MKFASIAMTVAAVALSMAAPAAAAVIDVGPQVDTFDGWTRGYYFTAPTAFTITGVYVPTDASSANQSIQVVRFNSSAPPIFSNTTDDFTSLGLWQDNAAAAFISADIDVAAGDIIGIYGWRGETNSYGSSNYLTQIGGYDVTLNRSGFQHSLTNQPASAIWSEASGFFGRVQFSYDLGGSAVPEPATWAMMIIGFAGVGGAIRTRRRQTAFA